MSSDSGNGANGNAPVKNPFTWLSRNMNVNMNPMPVAPNVATDPAAMVPFMGMPNFNSQFPFMDPSTSNVVPVLPQTFPVREVVQCSNATLYPPPHHVSIRTFRQRPPGCRTIFVVGYPENTTEQIIGEVFETCGAISAIRMSKKNFCHIRFECAEFVDRALFLSGYKMVINPDKENAKCSRLHVDYAEAREDQCEYECNRRAIERQVRHQKRLQMEKMRPASPPDVVNYTQLEAQQLLDKLRVTNGSSDSFLKAVNVLLKWLERGECTKRTSGMFYSLIQSINSSVRRLLSQKDEYEQNISKARELFNHHLHSITAQFNHIDKVFTATSQQKVWDHFTKAQRKYIQTWNSQLQEMKKAHLSEVWNESGEAEMDLSDDEDNNEPPAKKANTTAETDDDDKLSVLKEDNDAMKCQLEAYKNEIELNKSDHQSEIEAKDKQIKLLQHALQGVPKINKVPTDGAHDQAVENSGQSVTSSTASSSSCSPAKVSEDHARLIGIISTFLHVHPFGASLDYIWSYLQQFDSSLRPSDIENLMLSFPTVFKQQVSGVGAKIERKWIFQGFRVPNET